MGLRLGSDSRCIVYVVAVLVHLKFHHALRDLIFKLLFAAFSVRGRRVANRIGHTVLILSSKHAFIFRVSGLDVGL